MFFAEFFLHFCRHLRMFEDSLVWRFWVFFIGASILRLHLFFFKSSPHRYKMDQIRRKHIIHRIQRYHGLNTVKSLVADCFTNHMAVSFLHIHIVVFLSGTRTGKFYLFFLTPSNNKLVDKLRSGIWVRAEPWKGHTFLDCRHTFFCCFHALVPLRSRNHEIGCRIRVVERIDHISQERRPAMDNRINLPKARRLVFPGTGEDRNQSFQSAWPGGGYSFPTTTYLEKCTDPLLHRSLAHAHELLCRRVAMFPHLIPLENRNIFGNYRMQQFSANLVAGGPDVFQCRRYVLSVDNSPSGFLLRLHPIAHLFSGHGADDRFAVHLRDQLKSVKDLALLFSGSFEVFPEVFLKDLFFSAHSHGATVTPIIIYPVGVR